MTNVAFSSRKSVLSLLAGRLRLTASPAPSVALLMIAPMSTPLMAPSFRLTFAVPASALFIAFTVLPAAFTSSVTLPLAFEPVLLREVSAAARSRCWRAFPLTRHAVRVAIESQASCEVILS